MKELKIAPINIEASTTVAGIGKNISDVVAFQIALAKDVNRVIASFNEILPFIENTPAYDDSGIKHRVSKLEGKETVIYNDYEIQCKLLNALSEIKELKGALAKSNLIASNNQLEIRSNRNESGLKIDILEQKVNKIIEVK